jgi:hypothetical protein
LVVLSIVFILLIIVLIVLIIILVVLVISTRTIIFVRILVEEVLHNMCRQLNEKRVLPTAVVNETHTHNAGWWRGLTGRP